MKPDRQHPNRGFLYERTARDRMEAEFANAWEERQGPLNYFLDRIIGETPNRRDRFVAASVIQWLGSNVGFSFMVTCLHQSGYAVVGGEARAYKDTEPLLNELKQQQYNAEAAQKTFDQSEPS